jgi:hypothetical protein
VAAFYRQFDAFIPTGFEALNAADELGPSRYPVLSFLTSMRELRALFAEYLDAELEDAVPLFDIGVEFRVNEPRERGADRIIDWTLVSGTDRLSQRDKQRPLRWTLGDPAEIILRWAKDSPTFPVPAVEDIGRVDSRDRTVLFGYGDEWAILELIKTHGAAATELASRERLSRGILSFVVTTRTVPAGLDEVDFDKLEQDDFGPKKSGGNARGVSVFDEARVYVKVTLFTSKGEALRVPAFPDTAPALDTGAPAAVPGDVSRLQQ